METKKITDEMVAKLTRPLPAEAITENKQKTFLSSIKPIYITQRLNEVFGYGNWRTKVDVVTEKDDGSTVVKTTLEIPEYGVYLEQFGGHQDRDLGDSYKSSATDALMLFISSFDAPCSLACFALSLSLSIKSLIC